MANRESTKSYRTATPEELKDTTRRTQAAERSFRFTYARLAELKPGIKSYTVNDTGQHGLQCRVLQSGAMTFQVNRRPSGSSRMLRVKIAAVADQLPLDGTKNGVEGVRTRARKIIGQMESGIDPNEQARIQKAQEAAESTTLQQALTHTSQI